MRATSFKQISNGLAGVRDTLAIMRDLINAGKGNIIVRETALKLVSRLQQKDYLGEISAVHRFVRDCIRYVRDPLGLETIAEPWITLELRQGDCDDKAVTAGALLATLGFPVKLKAVGFMPGRCSHVLLSVFVAGHGWIDVETTEPVPLGWTPLGVKHTVTLGCY